MHETLSSFPEQFVDGPRKTEIKPEVPRETDRAARDLKCGWFWFKPTYLQKFRTAKWALFWLCWAGAMQGSYPYLYTIDHSRRNDFSPLDLARNFPPADADTYRHVGRRAESFFFLNFFLAFFFPV